MDSSLAKLLSNVVATYRRALVDDPAARARLAALGIDRPDLLERFQVGYSTGSLASLAGGEVLRQLQLLGLLDSGGRERFAGSIVVPAFDETGGVVQLAGYPEGGRVDWLFPDETPVLWNAAILASSREVAVAADPLAGILEIARGREAVVAPAGPGRPLGVRARDQLLAHGPIIELLPGADHLGRELRTLGISLRGAAVATPAEPGGTVETDADGFSIEIAKRLKFVVQGLHQESPRHLRASVKVFRKPTTDAEPPRLHLDTLDLYHARSRSAFAKTAACVLGEDPIAMETHVASIVTLAEEFLRKKSGATPVPVLSASEKAEAMKFLKDPKLLDRVLADLANLGYVGEEENKLVAYVASVSRKLEDPLSILVVSRSAAGKSTLADAVSALAPPEEVLRFTRLTAQTLYYQKPGSLSHRLVVIEEEAGGREAAYALRILQSSRRLSLSSAAGRGESKTHEVKGPVSLFVTTTRTDLDEETAGRFLSLSVDETPEQTRAILAAQRQAEACPAAEREHLVRLHQNAQRLLEPLAVVNPFAAHLTFPDDRLSARRDHRKYLGLIRAVAFLHQHQRRREEGSILVEPADIELANRLAHHTLGQSIYDLSAPSRRLLVELHEWLSERATREAVALAALRFSQREIRERVGWKRSQLAHHVRELVESEYLVVHTMPPGRKTRYALDWDGSGMDGRRFYRGLVDTTQLKAAATSGSLPGHFHGGTGRARKAFRGQQDRVSDTPGVEARER